MLLNKPLTRETTLENMPLGGLAPTSGHPSAGLVVEGRRLVTVTSLNSKSQPVLASTDQLNEALRRFYFEENLDASQTRINFAPCFRSTDSHPRLSSGQEPTGETRFPSVCPPLIRQIIIPDEFA